MSRDVDDIVDPAPDPVVTLVITASTITSELPWLDYAHVLIAPVLT